MKSEKSPVKVSALEYRLSLRHVLSQDGAFDRISLDELEVLAGRSQKPHTGRQSIGFGPALSRVPGWG